MERKLYRIANLLHQIAHDAGCVLLSGEDRSSARFLVRHYNRIHAHLGEVAPEIADMFGSLPDDAPAGEVRILARAMAAFLDERRRQRRRSLRPEPSCCGFLQAFALPICDPSC